MSVNNNVKRIVELVGGEENITSISHCFTRLRFILMDRSKVNDQELERAEGVIGLIDAGGQLQVVIGNSVSKYYEAALKMYPLTGDGPIEEENKENMSLLDKITDLASALFVPTVGILAACGTLQGFISLFTLVNVITEGSGTYLVLSTIADAIFYYYPVFIAYNAAKKFGGKPFISMIIALVMVHPNIINAANVSESMSFAGIPLLLIDYSKSVFPVILASYLASKVEKHARKYIPDVMKMIFLPLVVFLIVIPAVLLLVGPVITEAMTLVTKSVIVCYDFNPILSGIIVGGVWQFLVLFGISKAFIPIFATNFATFGYCPLVAIVFFASAMGQTGALLGFCFRSKNNKIRQFGIASGVAGFFGITEPALFGINVPARKPFLFGMVGGAVGGLIASIMGAKGYAFGSGITGIPALINPNGIDRGFYGAIIGAVVSFIVAFALSYILGWSEKIEKTLKV